MIAPDRLPGIRGALSYLDKCRARKARWRRWLLECVGFGVALAVVAAVLALAVQLVALAAGY